MIDTREDLIRALQEAGELEQGLIIQYLFGAFSLKTSEKEELSPEQASLVRDWKAGILQVAQEEMGHLGTVCNLLSAVGAPPHFNRPNFPKSTSYYPFPFDLVPFGDDFLYRIQVFELPRGAPLPPRHMCGPHALAARAAEVIVPDPLIYDRVGALYMQIAEAFKRIPERQLFIGPTKSQDDSEWSISLDIRRVYDRATTSAAIKDIIEDGEGTYINSPSSHFARFSRIRRSYVDAGCFDAARAVVANPATKMSATATERLTSSRTRTRRQSAIFSTALLLGFDSATEYFSRAGETDAQRTELKQSAQRTMSVAIRPSPRSSRNAHSGRPTTPPGRAELRAARRRLSRSRPQCPVDDSHGKARRDHFTLRQLGADRSEVGSDCGDDGLHASRPSRGSHGRADHVADCVRRLVSMQVGDGPRSLRRTARCIRVCPRLCGQT